jgi:hypothetical protein
MIGAPYTGTVTTKVVNDGATAPRLSARNKKWPPAAPGAGGIEDYAQSRPKMISMTSYQFSTLLFMFVLFNAAGDSSSRPVSSSPPSAPSTTAITNRRAAF